MLLILKHRRMKQAADVLRLEKETAEKLAAKAFAKSYLADLVPSVFNNLRENGYFYDPVERDLETGFMPWIIENTIDELDQTLVSRLLLDSLIREVVNKRTQDYDNLAEYLNTLKLNESNANLNESNVNMADIEQANVVDAAANDEQNEQNEQNNQQDDVIHLN